MSAETPGTPATRWPTDQLALAMCASDPHGCRGTTAAGRPCPWHRNLAENPAAFMAAREAAAYDRGRDEAARARLPYLAREVVAGLNAEVARMRAEVAAAERRGADALVREALRQLDRNGPVNLGLWLRARATAVAEGGAS